MRPLLFHHIPKTAGTSLNSLLGGLFGERHFIHIGKADAQTPAQLAQLVDGAPGAVKCISGHIPLHMGAGVAERVTRLTFLRNPVERILSLYRFSLIMPRDRRPDAGLPDQYSLAEFLACRHPEVIRHTENGMCRFLSGLTDYNNPQNQLFWKGVEDSRLLDAALANLGQMVFGIVECMEPSMALMRCALTLPFTLDPPHENATMPEPSVPPDLMLDIARRNALDLELYRAALGLLSARAISPPPPSDDCTADALFFPAAGGHYRVADIAGRFGFFSAEANGISWLHEGEAARICFVPQPGLRRLTLHIATITPDYPLAQMRLTLNGAPVEAKLAAHGGIWGRLELELPALQHGVNTLGFSQPYTVPVTEIHAGSPDSRRLGAGLVQVDAG